MISNSPYPFKVTKCPEFTQRYDSHEYLAQGSYGVVFKVHVKNLSADLFRAVKCISIPAEDSVISVEEAKKEALMTIKFAHENVIPVHEVMTIQQDDSSSVICIEMDYMKHGSLELLVSSLEPIKEDDLRKIQKQVCSALKYIWETYQMLHLDVNPRNVLIRRWNGNDICVCLCDFGTAKEIITSTLSQSSRSHATTTLIGTFDFIAPELLQFQKTLKLQQQQKQIDPNLKAPYSVKSDIFALGVTMAQLVTGDILTNYATLSGIVGAVRNDLIQKQRMPYSDSFISLIEKMLKKNPDERPTYDEIIRELDLPSGIESSNNMSVQVAMPSQEPPEHKLPPFDPNEGVGYDVLKQALGFLNLKNPFAFREDSVRVCPGCKHKVKFYIRDLANHSQLSCGCRLARRYNERTGIEIKGMCTCEYTLSINMK